MPKHLEKNAEAKIEQKLGSDIDFCDKSPKICYSLLRRDSDENAY